MPATGSGGVFLLGKYTEPGKGQQIGGCNTVFFEPETAAYGISRLRKYTYLQQADRACRPAICSKQKELAVLRQRQESRIQCHCVLAGGNG